MVPQVVRLCDHSEQVVSSCTTNVMSYDGWNHQSSGIARPIVRLCHPRSSTTGGATIHDWWFRSRKTYLGPHTIWNRRLEGLNMLIDLAATDFAMAIIHVLFD